MMWWAAAPSPHPGSVPLAQKSCLAGLCSESKIVRLLLPAARLYSLHRHYKVVCVPPCKVSAEAREVGE
jgi:hypothetical protein